MGFYKKILLEIEINPYWKNLRGKITDEELIKRIIKNKSKYEPCRIKK